MPTMPSAGAALVIVGARLMFMFTACVALGEMPLAHCTVNENMPLAVGVPESAPEDALSVRPPGNAPAVTLHVNAAGKPVALKLWL